MNGYLFAGYLVIWTILFLYLVYLTRQQKRVNKELKSLYERLGEPPE